MVNINYDNLKVKKYSRSSYIAKINNKGKSKRSIANGIFTINEIRQWKHIIKAFERDIKDL